MTRPSYSLGLHELGDGLFAYLQPAGTWGYSNAGLIAGEDSSLLVDTLFDLDLTREMLERMAPITGTRPIAGLVNTHANGDHCYGNQLVPERATIYATVAATEEMRQVPPHLLAMLKHAPDEEIRAFVDHAFGDFDFASISQRLPDQTFERELTLRVGERDVIIRDLGPAHTGSDSIVFVPQARTVFTGDLVFVRGTPVAWAGPISNWTAACEALLDLDADTFVPGHGPVCDAAGVRAVKAYFEYVWSAAAERHAGGMSSIDAAFDIDLGPFSDLTDRERIVATTETIYRELDPAREPVDQMTLFRAMGRYVKAQRSTK